MQTANRVSSKGLWQGEDEATLELDVAEYEVRLHSRPHFEVAEIVALQRPLNSTPRSALVEPEVVGDLRRAHPIPEVDV